WMGGEVRPWSVLAVSRRIRTSGAAPMPACMPSPPCNRRAARKPAIGYRSWPTARYARRGKTGHATAGTVVEKKFGGSARLPANQWASGQIRPIPPIRQRTSDMNSKTCKDRKTPRVSALVLAIAPLLSAVALPAMAEDTWEVSCHVGYDTGNM